jgi:hypothetical protein
VVFACVNVKPYGIHVVGIIENIADTCPAVLSMHEANKAGVWWPGSVTSCERTRGHRGKHERAIPLPGGQWRNHDDGLGTKYDVVRWDGGDPRVTLIGHVS